MRVAWGTIDDALQIARHSSVHLLWRQGLGVAGRQQQDALKRRWRARLHDQPVPIPFFVVHTTASRVANYDGNCPRDLEVWELVPCGREHLS